jgi:Sulfotransferase domain
MPRSGSTLQFQLTAHLVEHAGLGTRVEWVKAEAFPQLRETYAERGGWKVFKTHVCTAAVRAEFEAENAKGVYVFRDIRDVVVSRMRKRDEPFARLWERKFVDLVLTGFDRWTSLPAVLVSRYDEMVADVAGEVERIATHLGIAVGRDECEKVASEYTVARQRERIRDAEAGGRLQRSAHAHYDPVSNLHVDHIRSGQSGEWKSVLAREELAMVEDRAKQWLAANGYALSLSALQRVILKLRYARHTRRR